MVFALDRSIQVSQYLETDSTHGLDGFLNPCGPCNRMFFRPDQRTAYLWPGGALPCAPCYNGYEFANCSNNVCTQMIDCATVVRNVVATLESGAAHRVELPVSELRGM